MNRAPLDVARAFLGAGVTVLQAPGASGGDVVLKVGSKDASNVLFAANQTTLYFVIRPASGAAPTPGSLADISTVIATSRAR